MNESINQTINHLINQENIDFKLKNFYIFKMFFIYLGDIKTQVEKITNHLQVCLGSARGYLPYRQTKTGEFPLNLFKIWSTTLKKSMNSRNKSCNLWLFITHSLMKLLNLSYETFE